MLAENQPTGITVTDAAKIAGKMGMLTIAGIGIGLYMLYTVFIKR